MTYFECVCLSIKEKIKENPELEAEARRLIFGESDDAEQKEKEASNQCK